MTAKKRTPKLTGEECGQLVAIHLLVSQLEKMTENDALKARMNRVFDLLPFSEPDGLKS